MFKNKLFGKKALLYITYVLSFFATLLVLLMLIEVKSISDFFVSIENRTFDMRQSVLADYKYKRELHNKDIVILAVDDGSYEYLLDRYGEWPIPRDVYAKVVDYIEEQDPQLIAFDLMFVKSMKSSLSSDKILIDMFKKYDNVYTSMNFDDEDPAVRKPTRLPSKLSVNVDNKSDINYTTLNAQNDDLTFTNCRAILPQIIQATSKIGLINVDRGSDGILRKAPVFVKYQNKYYPHLSFLAGVDVINKTEKISNKNFVIDKNANVKLGKRAIPLNNDGNVILNWYGPAGTFEYIPFYKVLKAADGDKEVEKYDFKNKIIYVGVTTVSQYDIKSTPVSRVFPGVELHSTYINNMLDNNFIKKADFSVNVLISIILAIFVGVIVIRSASTIFALVTTLLSITGYVIISYLVMKYLNIWIAIVLPVMAMSLIFGFGYIVKYLLKSRDFDYQYKLATTDGLTELYNHRYFQEQMLMQIENCKRYNSHFSLILIDIDFFKKFNDTYGHQAGDAVLKQVAYLLKKNVRATDIVCRYGGEEMSIILTNTDKDEAIITAQKICQAIAQKPFKIGVDVETQVTISLGVATYPQDGSKVSELIETSDKGLYKAKENGRNQVGL